jgi:hypothetical protein
MAINTGAIQAESEWMIVRGTRRIACCLLPVLAGLLLFEQAAAMRDSASIDSSEGQPEQASGRRDVVYTLHGTKDPRLQATLLASYISTSKSEACAYRNPSTATRKVRIGSKTYPITEEHYRVDIPIYLEENENECGYRFSRIEVLLRRQYDRELYSRHILLANSPRVKAIYFGTKTGFGGGRANLTRPAEIATDKRHFRIARKTQYVCRTGYFERRHGSEFYCFMRIRDGEGENRFIPTNRQETVVTHPEFGIDEIESDILQVDFLADDQGSKRYTGKETLPDYFRTLSPPPEELKPMEELKRWFRGFF